MQKIDFVVTWVNGGDLNWRKEKEYWEKEYNVVSTMNADDRYRDWEFMKYWFRSVEKYAPWVNKIFFVTEGHLPEWLNTNHEKLIIVRHKDYIDEKYLPTYNSNVIELNFHKIKELAEHFVLFNDDMLLNDYVIPEDFFKNGKPRDTGIFSPIVPNSGGIASIVLNNMEIINKYFNTRDVLKKSYKKYFYLGYREHFLKNICVLPWKTVLGFYDSHIPISHKKSIFQHLYEKEKESFLTTYNNKFRNKNEINHWLMRYWNLCEGDFEVRKTSFGQNYELSDDLSDLTSEIRSSRHKMICLNDGKGVKDFQRTKEELLVTFEEKYPQKSTFEI